MPKSLPYPLWHPDTQMKTAPGPIKVKSGQGIYLTLDDGRKLMDMISSWWVNLHGHARPEIAKAIADQAHKLEQVIFADFTHEPAEFLAQGVLEQLPDSITRFFYSDDGSTAVEVALKMAWQYWANRGEKRRTFLCFEQAYHGDTFGSMSVGAPSVFTDTFEPLLFKVKRLPFPSTYLGDETADEKEEDVLTIIGNEMARNHGRYAAILLEPLIQGAGGMRMCRPSFLQKLEILAHEYDLPVIYDEVMTGFGRTGEWFACRKAGTNPDIVCLSKGITGGFLPLGATVCNEKIYQAFHSEDPYKAFYHGHSYTGNPLSCTAGLASLQILKKHPESFQYMEAWHKRNLEMLKDHPLVEKPRVCGTVAAVTIRTEGRGGYMNEIGKRLKYRFYEEGFLVRPLGNVVYFLPPYVITREELNSAYDCLRRLLDEL